MKKRNPKEGDFEMRKMFCKKRREGLPGESSPGFRRQKWWLGALLFVCLLLPLTVQAANTTAKPLVLPQRSLVLQKGDSFKLKPQTIYPKSALTWKSSKTSVATVTKSGKIKAKKPGTTRITVMADEYKAVCKVRVVSASLNKTKITLNSGDTTKLKLKNACGTVRWISSNPAVAYVNQKGKVLAGKKGTAVITASFGVSSLSCKVKVKYTKWDKALARYQKDPATNQLLFVQYTGGSRADILFYTKTDSGWKLALKCPGYVGYNGIGKEREGDQKTPTGTFTLTQGFGRNADPGAKLPYVKVNKYLYWCADTHYYNQLVDIREKPHSCNGEHLIDYVGSYDYGMFLDYNPQNIYKKGSAIFLHCFSGNPYTGGCISVSESNMIYLLRNTEPGAKILIYSK